MFDSSTDDSPGQPFAVKDYPIKLNVGGQIITAWMKTLTKESAFFDRMFSGDWNNQAYYANGGNFVDADPMLFGDVLAYLRSRTFQLFFNAAAGSFNYLSYQALLGQAKALEIPRLQQWIKQQCFRNAIELHHHRQLFSSEEALNNSIEKFENSSSPPIAWNVKHFSSGWGTKKVYLYPRGIPAHRGCPADCGKESNDLQGGDPRLFEDEPCFKGALITIRYTWKPEVCLGENFTSGVNA
ncbi:BTB/POZ fold domain containing protein [Apiospora phragmitis]|uniref:BTB/POZ fold domain containing protein n=1 Tax=Apiospora phragmitis TaxID=2905665 RepID=A0ABR1UGV2_9PEZI